MAAAGSDLLVFDDYGRIRFDYRFAEPIQASAKFRTAGID